MLHNSPNLFSFNEVQVTYHTKQLGPKVTSSRDAYDFLVDRWENIDYCEKFYVILLNRANKVQGVAFISEGSVGGTIADPKKIFQIALKANASAIIIGTIIPPVQCGHPSKTKTSPISAKKPEGFSTCQ